MWLLVASQGLTRPPTSRMKALMALWVAFRNSSNAERFWLVCHNVCTAVLVTHIYSLRGIAARQDREQNRRLQAVTPQLYSWAKISIGITLKIIALVICKRSFGQLTSGNTVQPLSCIKSHILCLENCHPYSTREFWSAWRSTSCDSTVDLPWFYICIDESIGEDCCPDQMWEHMTGRYEEEREL